MFRFQSRCSSATVHGLGSLLFWKLSRVVRVPTDLAVDAADAPLLLAVWYSEDACLHGVGIWTSFRPSTLGNVHRATTACTFSTSQLPRVVREWCALTLFTSKCASCHNGLHFFNISTSKSRPNPTCFDTSLPNVLRATTACTFSTSQLPRALRDRCVLTLFTSTCASRHNGVHFFISHLPRCPCTRRFSEPTFRPFGAKNTGKTECFATSLPGTTFSRTCIFSLLTFSISYLLPSDFLHVRVSSNFLRTW